MHDHTISRRLKTFGFIIFSCSRSKQPTYRRNFYICASGWFSYRDLRDSSHFKSIFLPFRVTVCPLCSSSRWLSTKTEWKRKKQNEMLNNNKLETQSETEILWSVILITFYVCALYLRHFTRYLRVLPYCHDFVFTFTFCPCRDVIGTHKHTRCVAACRATRKRCDADDTDERVNEKCADRTKNDVFKL